MSMFHLGEPVSENNPLPVVYVTAPGPFRLGEPISESNPMPTSVPLSAAGAGAGTSLEINTHDFSAGQTGTIAALSCGLAGTLTYSRLTGSAANTTIDNGGHLATTLGAAPGATITINARVQNDLGDAIERRFILTAHYVLGVLSLATAPSAGQPVSILGASDGTSITSPDLPTGVVLNSGDRKITFPTAGQYPPFTLRETGAGAVGSPRDTVITGLSVAAASSFLQSNVVYPPQTLTTLNGSGSIAEFDTGSLEQEFSVIIPAHPWPQMEVTALLHSDGATWVQCKIDFAYDDDSAHPYTKFVGEIAYWDGANLTNVHFLYFQTVAPGDKISFRATRDSKVTMLRNGVPVTATSGHAPYAINARPTNATKMKLDWTGGPMTLNALIGSAISGLEVVRTDLEGDYIPTAPITYGNAAGQAPAGYEIQLKRADASVVIPFEDCVIAENSVAGYATLRGQTPVPGTEAGTTLTVTIRQKNYVGSGSAPVATSAVYRPRSSEWGTNLSYALPYSGFRQNANLYSSQGYFQLMSGPADVSQYIDDAGNIKSNVGASPSKVCFQMPLPDVSGAELEMSWESGDPNFAPELYSQTLGSTISSFSTPAPRKRRFSINFTRNAFGADFIRNQLQNFDNTDPPQNIDIREVGMDKKLRLTPTYVSTVLNKVRGPMRLMDRLNTNNNNGVVLTTAQRSKAWSPNTTAYGISWEEQVYYANISHRDIFVNISPSMSNQYITDWATFLDTHLVTGLKVHAELSNEVWNTGLGAYHWFRDNCLAAGRCTQAQHDEYGGINAVIIEKTFQHNRVMPAFLAGFTSGRSVTRWVGVQIGTGDLEACIGLGLANYDGVLQAPYVGLQPSGGNTPAEMYAPTLVELENGLAYFEGGGDGNHGLKYIRALGKRSGVYEFGFDQTNTGITDAQRAAWSASPQAADILGKLMDRIKGRCGDIICHFDDVGFSGNALDCWGLTWQGDTVGTRYPKYLEVQGISQTIPVCTAGPSIATSDGGATYTFTPGTYTNSPTSVTRQWRRDGVAIAGEIGLSYTKVSADNGHTIYCDEIVNNVGAIAAVYSSNYISIVGATKVGPDLTANGSPTFQTGATGFGQERLTGYGVAPASDGTDVLPATNVWTAEAIISRASNPSAEEVIFGISGKLRVEVQSNGHLLFAANGSSTYFMGGPAVCDGARHCIAIVSNGVGNHDAGGFYGLVDGVVVGHFDDVTLINAGGSGAFSLGADADGSRAFGGTIDEFASWTTARYTANYTPAPAPYVGNETGIKALHHLDGTLNAAII